MYSHKTTTTGYVRPAMSHSVTVTRTTTTTTSAIIVNTGYLKSFPGLLKVFEVILASVCLGIICYYGHSTRIRFLPVEFFMSVSTAVLVGSFCLLLSCIITLSTAAIISKTIYELVYHFIAFILVLAASVTLLVEVNNRSYSDHPFFSASIIGLVLSALYIGSTIFAYRSYRGI